VLAAFGKAFLARGFADGVELFGRQLRHRWRFFEVFFFHRQRFGSGRVRR
jgi:hypothetical protein